MQKCATFVVALIILQYASAQCDTANSIPGYTLQATNARCSTSTLRNYNVGSGSNTKQVLHEQNFPPVCPNPALTTDVFDGSISNPTSYPDTFKVTSDETYLYVARNDGGTAWAQDVIIRCYDGATPMKASYMTTSALDHSRGADPNPPLARCEGDCDADSGCGGSLMCFQRTDEGATEAGPQHHSPSVNPPGCTGSPHFGVTPYDYCYDGAAQDSVIQTSLVKGNQFNTRSCAHMCTTTTGCTAFTVHTGGDEAGLCELFQDCASQPASNVITGFTFVANSNAKTCTTSTGIGTCYDWDGTQTGSVTAVTSTDCGVGKRPGEAAVASSFLFAATIPSSGTATAFCENTPCSGANDIAACCNDILCSDKDGSGGGAVTDSECQAGESGGPFFRYNAANANSACSGGSAGATACDVSTVGAVDHSTCCTSNLCTAASGHASVVITTGSSLYAGSLDYTVVCAAGYGIPGNASPNPTPCTTAGQPYTYTQCTALVCTSPDGSSGNAGNGAYTPTNDATVVITETQLNVVTGFSVSIACAAGYIGNPTATACTSSGAYTYTPCIPPPPPPPLVWPPPPPPVATATLATAAVPTAAAPATNAPATNAPAAINPQEILVLATTAPPPATPMPAGQGVVGETQFTPTIDVLVASTTTEAQINALSAAARADLVAEFIALAVLWSNGELTAADFVGAVFCFENCSLDNARADSKRVGQMVVTFVLKEGTAAVNVVAGSDAITTNANAIQGTDVQFDGLDGMTILAVDQVSLPAESGAVAGGNAGGGVGKGSANPKGAKGAKAAKAAKSKKGSKEAKGKDIKKGSAGAPPQSAKMVSQQWQQKDKVRSTLNLLGLLVLVVGAVLAARRPIAAAVSRMASRMSTDAYAEFDSYAVPDSSTLEPEEEPLFQLNAPMTTRKTPAYGTMANSPRRRSPRNVGIKSV